VGVIIAVVGLILLLIGFIGLIILMFKLRDDLKDDLFLVAGILFIIGIFVPILTIIAWVLVYVGAKPEKVPTRHPYGGVDILPPPPPA
jgi:hypothetical protein